MIEIMKRAALDAVEAQKPAAVLFGTVESASPLRISVEQKIVLGEAQLVLTRAVSDYEMGIELDAFTEAAGDLIHSHGISGRKSIRILSGLEEGEQVLLLRMSGGQKYIVLDRVVNA